MRTKFNARLMEYANSLRCNGVLLPPLLVDALRRNGVLLPPLLVDELDDDDGNFAPGIPFGTFTTHTRTHTHHNSHAYLIICVLNLMRTKFNVTKFNAY